MTDVRDRDMTQGTPGQSLHLQQSETIQGNILAGFNKSRQAFVFLRFTGANRREITANARRWLTELTDLGASRVTSTRAVVAFRDARRRKPDLTSAWLNVSLTCSGLLKLHPELEPDLDGYQAFRSGPTGKRDDETGGKTTAELLGDVGDSGPERWVIGGQDLEPDVLLTIAADGPKALSARIAEERKRAKRSDVKVLRVLQGKALPRAKEHFGFRDGISQPGILGFTGGIARRRRTDDARPAGPVRWEDAQQRGTLIINPGEFVLGAAREQWNDGPDIPKVPSWMKDGSFHVFRRLEQDVAAWRAAMERLALPGLSADRLAAMAIGREPDGKPLITGGSGDNDFDYDDDPAGHQVPRWAHCRKVNPRNPATFSDRSHRILRRGVPYGPVYDPRANPETAKRERGLLFNAFMTSIDQQFELLQRKWMDDPKFPAVPLDTPDAAAAIDDGVDPVAGTGAHPCRLRVPGHEDRRLDFGRFVHTRGAAYALAPSIPTLRRLAGDADIAVGEFLT